MSALPPKADMCGATRYVRFVPKADISNIALIISATHGAASLHRSTKTKQAVQIAE